MNNKFINRTILFILFLFAPGPFSYAQGENETIPIGNGYEVPGSGGGKASYGSEGSGMNAIQPFFRSGRKNDPGILEGIHYSISTGPMIYDVLRPRINLFIQNQLAYHFSPHFSAGVGVGLQFKTDFITLKPVYLDLRGYFMEDGTTTPYAFVNGGYSFVHAIFMGFPELYQGGYFGEVGGGVKFSFSKEGVGGLLLGVGYNVQKVAHRTQTDPFRHFHLKALRVRTTFLF